MINLKEMNAKELKNLKIDIDAELEKRERLEYDKALKDFADAFYELYSNYPNKCCFTDWGTTWEDLYENNNWNF